ncbi:type II TA system antitoxin MqsA family protein [Sedimentisphaera salicampi]|uniref:Putative zinc finger/helix-turn-helix protein, YgiT family n=1 Tax=Sedimentisphaera salicampi TaxID=1941349 RepID=A0A1W6LMT2_9BACT|nr:type II TA system antitoxin MqsA family protein [Sedimentisphaera salicampi]ARN57056.1 putative zinc finger/helix-turn-helix protein, YgiT family [Sedimentisphaera salicampi]
MSKFCFKCGDFRDTFTKTVSESYKIRGENIEIEVDREFCSKCSEMLGSDKQDAEIQLRLYSIYRKRADLLSPEEIRNIRSGYGLSQRSFANLLGMSEATINRYERGALQDKTHDNLIRACKSADYVRDLLTRNGSQLSSWQKEKANKAINNGAGKQIFTEDFNEQCFPNEISLITGYRNFSYERFSKAVIFLCSEMGEVCTTVLNKLLFYADFICFAKSTVSLTGSAYRRLIFGPVPSDYDGAFSRMVDDKLIKSEEVEFDNGICGFYFSTSESSEDLKSVFSKSEIKVLEFIANKFKGMKAKDISDLSHKEDAWLHTNDRDLITYDYATNLKITMPD